MIHPEQRKERAYPAFFMATSMLPSKPRCMKDCTGLGGSKPDTRMLSARLTSPTCPHPGLMTRMSCRTVLPELCRMRMQARVSLLVWSCGRNAAKVAETQGGQEASTCDSCGGRHCQDARVQQGSWSLVSQPGQVQEQGLSCKHDHAAAAAVHMDAQQVYQPSRVRLKSRHSEITGSLFQTPKAWRDPAPLCWPISQPPAPTTSVPVPRQGSAWPPLHAPGTGPC